MNLSAFENVSQKASNIGAQQKIAEGIQEHGLGDRAGLIFGMNMAQGMNTQTAAPVSQSTTMSLDEQIAAVTKLKGLLDAGILSQEEFEVMKKEIMGLLIYSDKKRSARSDNMNLHVRIVSSV